MSIEDLSARPHRDIFRQRSHREAGVDRRRKSQTDVDFFVVRSRLSLEGE